MQKTLFSAFIAVLAFISFNIQSLVEVSAQLLSERYGSWSYRCEVAEPNAVKASSCEISQIVQVEQENGVVDVLHIALAKDGKNALQFTILAPLNLHLPSGFAFSWGKNTSSISQFLTCSATGCISVLPAENTVISTFKKKNEASGLFRLANGQTVKIVFSLKGFTKAYNALRSGTLPAVNLPQQSPAS